MSESGTAGACVDGTALDGATGVSVSPDGTSVYVASETSRAVAVFARDAATGAIVQLEGTTGCVSESGTGGACADGRALVGPRSLALSPDGENLYFPASGSRAVAVFGRAGATGALDQLTGTDGCVSETGTGGTCVDGTALDGARGVALSPEGRHVYVASFFADAVAVFERSQTTGALAQLPGLDGCMSETGTDGACADGRGLDGPRSAAASPDGRNLYVASEASGAVSVFSRDGTTGEIVQLPGTAGCVSQTGLGGACADVRALGIAADVVVSHDGENVYVTAMGSDAVAAFSRDPATGALTQLSGTSGCVSETGTGGSCVDGRALDRARGIAISPDDAYVYVGSEISDAVSVFARDTSTGSLTQLGGAAGCVSETGTGGTCADGIALDGTRSVAVTPDGATVYAASFWSSAVAVFARDAGTGALTQLGSPAPPPPPPPPEPTLWLSLRAAAAFGGVAAADEDILAFDGSAGVGLSFDGSDVGLSGLRIDAFAWLDADSLLLSFDAAGSVPGIADVVDDSDVVQFEASSLGATTAGAFQPFFDGSDVGLTAGAHDVDAIERLPDGTLLLSATGRVSIRGVVGLDEDLLAFTPTSLGPDTSGSFALRFDGSDVGLSASGEDVDAVALDTTGGISLSTFDAFAVPGVTGADEDVFLFSPTALDPPTTAGTYATTLSFDGSAFGLGANDVSAIDVP